MAPTTRADLPMIVIGRLLYFWTRVSHVASLLSRSWMRSTPGRPRPRLVSSTPTTHQMPTKRAA